MLVSAAVIKVTVKRAALRRGIKNPYQLAKRIDNAHGQPSARSEELARRLWKGERLPKLESIDLVAGALGDCNLLELLARTPNGHTKRRRSGTARNGAR